MSTPTQVRGGGGQPFEEALMAFQKCFAFYQNCWGEYAPWHNLK